MIIDLFTVLPLTCAVFVVLLGVFIISKNPRSRMHQLLSAFCGCMFFWLFGTFMMFSLRGQGDVVGVFWDRFVYIGVTLMPPLMQHFSLEFARRRVQRALLWANYLVSVFFLLASRTPYFVDGLYVYSWGAHSRAQILHHAFLVYFFLAVSVFFINIWSYYRRLSDRRLRLQAVYVFLAFALVMFVGGTAYLYAYGIDTKFPFAYITGLTFPIILFYAVIRHGLLDTKVIGTEILVGATNFVLVTQVFLSATPGELFARLAFAMAITAIGILLVRSVRSEVKRREEIAVMAASLEKANLRLQELDRQKTDFLSIASHQLRTPLSILKGYIELIQDGAYGRASAKLKKTLSDMDESNERLVKLVDEFLNISRIEQGRTKFSAAQGSLRDEIGSVVSELSPKADAKGIAIEWRAPKDEGAAIMDKEKIRHVIFNFVDNAIKYSDDGTVRVALARSGGGYSVAVRDQGIGFGKNDGANFFQKFYRGENVKTRQVDGTGLGLYVCYKFIEAHGGRVWGKSAGAGKGSEFGFWIPLKMINNK